MEKRVLTSYKSPHRTSVSRAHARLGRHGVLMLALMHAHGGTSMSFAHRLGARRVAFVAPHRNTCFLTDTFRAPTRVFLRAQHRAAWMLYIVLFLVNVSCIVCSGLMIKVRTCACTLTARAGLKSKSSFTCSRLTRSSRPMRARTRE